MFQEELCFEPLKIKGGEARKSSVLPVVSSYLPLTCHLNEQRQGKKQVGGRNMVFTVTHQDQNPITLLS